MRTASEFSGIANFECKMWLDISLYYSGGLAVMPVE